MPIALRKRTRSYTLHPISKFVPYHRLSFSYQAFTSNLSSEKNPKFVLEALMIPVWRKAILEEVQALEKKWHLAINGTSKSEDSRSMQVGIYQNMQDNEIVYICKARLVANGYTQTQGIDYQKTSTLVAKMNTIRGLLSLLANVRWSLHQLDIKNAFLNGELKEHVYKQLPLGFDNLYGREKVCKLKRSLYGLKPMLHGFVQNVKCGYMSRCLIFHNLNFRIQVFG